LSAHYLGQYYIINIKNYLKRLHLEVYKYSVGIHVDSESPHIHIHYLIKKGEARVPKVMIQDWKYKYNTGKVQAELPVLKHEGEKINWPSLTEYKHKKKINISIKWTDTPLKPEESLERFLAYPFKEGYVFEHNLEEEEVTQLKAQAQGEWNSVKIKKIKEQQRIENSQSEYGKICDIISSNSPESYQDAVRIVLEEIKKNRIEYKDHINPRNVIQSVQKFCYHTGIWTIDEIIEKFA
jgi:hypothetical protein